MKKFPHALTMAFIALTSPLAFAASSTDLSVTGTITPRACTPLLSEGGNVDHGKISSKDLNKDKVTKLAIKTLQLTVNCDSPIAFRLNPIDNQLGSSIDTGFMWGLGKINGDQNLGGYELQLSAPLADGVSVYPLISYDNGSTWTRSSFMAPSAISSFSATSVPAIPVAIKDLVTNLKVYTVIARADSLDLTNDAAIDGSATLEVLYP
ncbi:DUF1120 domain-containing protein [Pseudomonas sp. SJZ080]|uniref:DUF1120 domain-containing protein n=1 Tax=Pseudomonas sp. SJZ080 TaxID=2572888 RepID=UPI0011A62EA6|nr:DUF1120 domain-containing protein [Pseudomonas sp. SJZ080]